LAEREEGRGMGGGGAYTIARAGAHEHVHGLLVALGGLVVGLQPLVQNLVVPHATWTPPKCRHQIPAQIPNQDSRSDSVSPAPECSLVMFDSVFVCVTISIMPT
jgi:hypothetical protein